MPRSDISDERFGRLVAIREVEKIGVSRRWLVRCDCGTEKVVYQQQLSHTRERSTRSCGCLQREMSAARRTTHGACRGGKITPEYGVWSSMISRCENPNAAGFATHGSRSIKVCKRWRTSFANFLADVGIRPSPKHSLEREDNDGNYEPSNCRWATDTEQMRNTRWSKRFVVDGKTLCLHQLASHIGISRSALRRRLENMSVEEAIATKKYTLLSPRKLGDHNRVVSFRGKEVTIAHLAKQTGVAWPTMRKRLERMTPEEAVAFPYKSRRKRK